MISVKIRTTPVRAWVSIIQLNIIIKTDVARGGLLIYYASLLEVLGIGKGSSIGADIEIREHN